MKELITEAQNCPYNGNSEDECQCDECDRFLECYPEYDEDN